MLALGVTLAAACVGDIDFDEIEPMCQEPMFDSPTRDEYCSGRQSVAEIVFSKDEIDVLGAATDGRGHSVIFGGEDGTESPDTGVAFTRWVAWLGGPIDEAVQQGPDRLTMRTIDLMSPLPPILRVHYATEQYATIAFNVLGFAVGISLAGDEEDPFIFLPNSRLPPNPPPNDPDEEEGDPTYLQIDTIEKDGELRVYATSLFSGIKVFRFRDDGEKWIEVMPQIELPSRIDTNDFLASLTAANRRCLRQCSDDQPVCDALRACHAFALPGENLTTTLVADEEADVVYVGGFGVIYAIEDQALRVNNEMPAANLRPVTFADSFALLSEVGSADVVPVEMLKDEDILYVVVGDALDGFQSPFSARLLVIRLQDGQLDRQLAEVDLGFTYQFFLQFVDLTVTNDLLVIKVLGLDQNLGTTADATIDVFDVIDPGRPRRVFSTTAPTQGSWGLTGMVGGQTGVYLPVLDGLAELGIQLDGGPGN